MFSGNLPETNLMNSIAYALFVVLYYPYLVWSINAHGKNYSISVVEKPRKQVESTRNIRYSSDPSCNVEFRLRWSAHLGSAAYATPVIFPFGPEGQKSIFLSTYFQYVEVIGYDGSKPWGWPLNFEGSSFRGSPVLYDIDRDGVLDIGVVDKNANMYWIRMGSYGQYLEDYHIQVPKLRVKRDWHVNLDPSFSDFMARISMFDFESETFSEPKSNQRAKPDIMALAKGMKPVNQLSYPEQGKVYSGANRKLFQANAQGENDTAPAAHIDLLKEDSLKFEDLPNEKKEEESEEEPASMLPYEIDDYMQAYIEHHAGNSGGEFGDFNVPDENEVAYHYGEGSSVRGFHEHYYGAEVLDGMYNASQYVFVDPHVLSSPTLADVNGDGEMEVVFAVSYYFDETEYRDSKDDFDRGNYIAGAVACWNLGLQAWSWIMDLDLTTDKSKFRAYIHGSPTVVDMDGDGRVEVIVGTSMGLLYVLDGDTGFVRRHFPMQFYEIESQVAVADVNGDGHIEMIVADMRGNLAVVSIDGAILWDIQLPSLDVNTYNSIPYTPTLGDVNGDGFMDIAVVTVERPIGDLAEAQGRGDAARRSALWVIDAKTGAVLPSYPIALPKGAVVTSPVVLVDLHDNSGAGAHHPMEHTDPKLPPWMLPTEDHAAALGLGSSARRPENQVTNFTNAVLAKLRGGTVINDTDGASGKPAVGLHMMISSFDGHIYLVDGVHGCAERLDIGERLLSMPLVDDVTNDGYLDLVVGTVNGDLMLFETSIPYHPLNTWTSFPKHRMNGFTHGEVGITIPEVEKRMLERKEVQGDRKSVKELEITFDIWDRRKAKKTSLNKESKYKVTITKGTNRESVLLKASYSSPGRYTVTIPVSPPQVATYCLGMTTEHGQYYEDVVTVSINTRFYVWLKYLLFVPVLLLCLPLLLMKPHDK